MLIAIGILVILLAAVIGLTLLALGFPGTLAIWVMVAIFAFATGLKLIGGTSLIVMASMMVAAEGIEFALGYYGAKKYGSSRRAAMFSIIGGLLGGIIGAGLGGGLLSPITSFLGVFAGTFIGAFLAAYHENRDLANAGKVGKGAVLGRVMGLAAKVFFALSMLVTALIGLFL
jgi:uncharacterized protein